jgi:hypothetical protein
MMARYAERASGPGGGMAHADVSRIQEVMRPPPPVAPTSDGGARVAPPVLEAAFQVVDVFGT